MHFERSFRTDYLFICMSTESQKVVIIISIIIIIIITTTTKIEQPNFIHHQVNVKKGFLGFKYWKTGNGALLRQFDRSLNKARPCKISVAGVLDVIIVASFALSVTTLTCKIWDSLDDIKWNRFNWKIDIFRMNTVKFYNMW